MEQPVAESSVFGKRRGRRKRLTAVRTTDLLTTIGVHPLVATQIRELRVRLGADLAPKRFHRRMDVLVLLEAARRCERLAAAGAAVRPRTGGGRVCGADVTLKIARVGERARTRIAGEQLLLVLLLLLLMAEIGTGMTAAGRTPAVNRTFELSTEKRKTK